MKITDFKPSQIAAVGRSGKNVFVYFLDQPKVKLTYKHTRSAIRSHQKWFNHMRKIDDQPRNF